MLKCGTDDTASTAGGKALLQFHTIAKTHLRNLFEVCISYKVTSAVSSIVLCSSIFNIYCFFSGFLFIFIFSRLFFSFKSSYTSFFFLPFGSYILVFLVGFIGLIDCSYVLYFFKAEVTERHLKSVE